jgi:uncharacterized membrane protein
MTSGQPPSPSGPLPPPPPPNLPAGRLGVVEAMGLSWRLMMTNFWTLWLMGFLAFLLEAFSGPGVIVVGPAVTAGLLYVLARQADGREVRVGMLFQGFSKRFAEAVIAMLVPYGVQLAAPLLWLPVHLAIIFGALGTAAGAGQKPDPVLIVGALVLDYGILFVFTIAGLAVRMFFVFAIPGVWDRPKAGWQAAKESVRLVRENLGAVLGLMVLFILVGLAAQIAGMIACCIGVWFTVPIVHVWFQGTVLYLYRSWTGRGFGWDDESDAEQATKSG